MSVEAPQGRTAPVEFTGRRSELFGLLFRGYFLMIPTIGIYRFWVTTWKRRYYWQNTVIDGDPLEYDGNALQLLIGFLFALAFFLPIYIGFFYLSTQAPGVVIAGYGAVAGVIWFLMGYAIYRARDFRLSRTLWRGIRFNQHGNAWAYALRRFLWSIAMVLTLGLIYPAMAGSLWRYRYNHSWYGDRQFRWTGSWKTIAGPFYRCYFLIAGCIIAAVVMTANAPTINVDGASIPGPESWGAIAGSVLAGVFLWFYYRAREASRMFSEIHVGTAKLAVKVGARALFGQFVLFVLSFTGAALVLIVIGVFILAGLTGGLYPGGEGGPAADFARLAQSGWLAILALVFGYLLILGTFTLFAEVFLGYGYWMLVARGATITDADSLKSVRASGEDPALAGEGLADALNVGAY